MYPRRRIDSIRKMKCQMVADQWKDEERILYRTYGFKPYFFPELLEELKEEEVA